MEYFLPFKKEDSSIVTDNVDESLGHYTKWSNNSLLLHLIFAILYM